MLLLFGVLVLGILVGLALGGKLRNLEDISFRWWPLGLVGLALQIVPVSSAPAWRWVSVGLLIASYVVLAAFVLANVRLPGFPLMAVGFALNLLAVSVNGGMPVNVHALRVAYGAGGQELLQALEQQGGAKHHVARPDDVLLPLTDVVPVPPPVHTVLSVGDILSLVGAAWVMAGVTLGSAGSHRRRRTRPSRAGPTTVTPSEAPEG